VLALARQTILMLPAASGGGREESSSLSLSEWGRRPELPLADLLRMADVEPQDEEAVHWADVELKYSGYIARERRSAVRLEKMEALELPSGVCYGEIQGLSREAVEKLDRVRPATLAQAGMVPGIAVADLHLLAHAVAKGRVSRETGNGGQRSLG
jgi:tRNA uridine 5-carboxymethylaminomethyl modification enzyme